MDKLLGTLAPIATLAIGASVTFAVGARTFTVKRLRQAVWHLRDHAITGRSRFGTLQEITRDVASVYETGALPGGHGGRW